MLGKQAHAPRRGIVCGYDRSRCSDVGAACPANIKVADADVVAIEVGYVRCLRPSYAATSPRLRLLYSSRIHTALMCTICLTEQLEELPKAPSPSSRPSTKSQSKLLHSPVCPQLTAATPIIWDPEYLKPCCGDSCMIDPYDGCYTRDAITPMPVLVQPSPPMRSTRSSLRSPAQPNRARRGGGTTTTTAAPRSPAARRPRTCRGGTRAPGS